MVPVRIENRAQLIYLLTEAAELEHGILCCYLFAACTMKNDTSEGLTAEQLELVQSWRKTIGEIMVQEMTHLATACNLLVAVGGAPHFSRPNLPTSPRAYPPAFRMSLVPFGVQAVDQFVMLERPEALVETEDYRATAVPLDRLSDIFSSERNYESVGQLYRGIQDGFTYLAQKLGEDGLFVGPPTAQTASPFFDLPGLEPVHDLESALAAIEVIVEQGEGASIDVEDSHYSRFHRMREEYGEALAADPNFAPARPVLVDPFAILPGDVSESNVPNLIDDPTTADVCNLFDGCYEVTVQVLGRLFVHADETEGELAAYADVAVGMMIEVIAPLGSALTRLPAGPSHPGLGAGPSFRLSRASRVPAHAEPARQVFRERLSELARYCQFLQAPPEVAVTIGEVREALDRYAAQLESSVTSSS